MNRGELASLCSGGLLQMVQKRAFQQETSQENEDRTRSREILAGASNREEHSASCGDLETIEETDDDEFQYSCAVEKQSRSGLLFNKRVISLDQQTFCYFSEVQLSDHNRRVEKHRPKVQIRIKDITDLIIPSEKPTHLRVVGKGFISKKDKVNQRQESFNYLFRFRNEQMPALWINLIQAAKHAEKKKSYLVTFENLIKYSRSLSS